MKVTAWNNGQHHVSGAGYGLKIRIEDRDKYLNKEWKNIILELSGEKNEVIVNIDKHSFWDPICRELISKEIGLWLIKNGKARWPKDHPPKLKMEHLYSNRFKVEFL